FEDVVLPINLEALSLRLILERPVGVIVTVLFVLRVFFWFSVFCVVCVRYACARWWCLLVLPCACAPGVNRGV
ncbi:hypothetical protein ACQWHJ_25700, partial [Salmonella enterica subsp. enterica serovar Infantis]